MINFSEELYRNTYHNTLWELPETSANFYCILASTKKQAQHLVMRNYTECKGN